MRNKHHIVFGHENAHCVTERLQAAQVPFNEEYLVLDIYEDHAGWESVQTLIHEYPPIIHFCESHFTHEELQTAEWVHVFAIWHNGYPQPESSYKEATYDLSGYCEECGTGATQIRPFRLRGEPNWGTRHIFALNWVFDAIFVRPEVWKTVFLPKGIDCWPVLKHSTSEQLQTVVQLSVDALLPGPLKLDGYPYEICARCHRTKYRVIGCGKFPPMTEEPSSSVHAALTQEYFGSGGGASRRLFVRRDLYLHLHDIRMKPVHYVPVST
jgi:hypothetical protein